MESFVDSDYIEIGIVILKKTEDDLLYDLFIQRSTTSFTKIFNCGEKIDQARLTQYERKGVRYFCVPKDQYENYLESVIAVGEEMVEDPTSFSTEESARILKEMINYSMYQTMINGRVDQKILDNSNNVVNSCVKGLVEDKKGFLRVINLMSSKPYIFKHSIMVSIFSILLAKVSGYDNSSTLNTIGLGAFLHDVGLSQLDFDPETVELLTPDQRKEMSRHPELGKRLLDNLKDIKEEVLSIVLQHHEQPNGMGYPNSLRDSQIYPPAKIVAIADTFSSLISKRPFRDEMVLVKALEEMRSDSGKFDKNLLDNFVMLLTGK